MTPLPIEITDLAAEHIRDADAWWRKHRLSVPNAVREDLDKAFQMIGVQPHIGSRADDVEMPGVRRVYLGRIKYHLYHRLAEDPLRVQIVALWHKSRGDGPPL